MKSLRRPPPSAGRSSASPPPPHSRRVHPLPSRLHFPSKPSAAAAALSAAPSPSEKPVVVVGSANADIYLEIDRLPAAGETISARSGETLAGGKGANQACCGGRLAHPTRFIGQVGDDAHGRMLEAALEGSGVEVGRLARVAGAPTGHAVVMLQPDGQNSIVIVGGANVDGWPASVAEGDLEVVRGAGVLLLQREIPDRVNVQVAKAAKGAGVPVILDAGGMEGSVPKDLLQFVDILSPNESELSRLTGLPTDTPDNISQAAAACHRLGVKEILVKLGSKGSALFVEGEEPIWQPIVEAPKVLDTTGAGDTFTAAFAVALVEGKTRRDCLQFAAAAASLCVQVKGAMPSMPDRAAVMDLLHSLQA